MHESITMAEVGSIVNVSGNSIATPFGPPRPGSTPTKMPSTSPTIIKASVFHVSRTPKPCRSSAKASMKSISKQGFEGALRHDDVEGDIERDEHGHREHEARQQRLPERDASDQPHKAGDQQEAGDIEPEPLRRQAEQECRDEHLHHAAKLVPCDKDLIFIHPAEKN